MQVTEFVTVVQRRKLTIDSTLFPLISPLFAIETHMSMEERISLGGMAMKLPMQFVACEIGSYLGASACFLAAAASFKQGTIHCVDTWDNRAMDSEAQRDTYAEFLHNTERFKRYIVPHRGEASVVSAEVPAELDMLFLDGDHSYDAVKSELSIYASRLKSGGFLLLHDCQQESVQRAANEYLSTSSAVDMGTTHSLRILQISGESIGQLK